MKDYTISSNGDHEIGASRGRYDSIISIESNTDGATLTWGYKSNHTSAFVAFTDGVQSTVGTFKLHHGIGTTIMLRVSGYVSHPILLSVSK